MLNRSWLLAVLVAGLALALSSSVARAVYDPWPAGKVCGQNTCFAVHGKASAALLSWDTSAPYALASAPKPAPFYVIRFTTKYRTLASINEEVLYVPSRNMVRIYYDRTFYGPKPDGPYWRVVPKSATPQMNRVVTTVAPRRALRSWPHPAG
jgi:hypothetical protein